MPERIFLFLVGWCIAIISWQTFAYPPTYLPAAWVWATLAGVAAATCLLAAVLPQRGFAVLAGAALICHSIGRSAAIILQLLLHDDVTSTAPFANYAVAASTWALVGLLAFQVWAHYVLPWSASRRTL